MKVTLNIFRFDPDSDKEPWYQTVETDSDPEETIMGVLNYVRDHIDPSLACRSVCNCQKCGECAVMVNARPCLACETTVEPEMTVEPLPNFTVIKDLVVDRSQAFIKPFELISSLKTPLLTKQLAAITQNEFDTSIKLTGCIACLMCQSVCPALEKEPDRFAGPLGLIWLAQRSIVDTDNHWEEKAREALDQCVFCGDCWATCPHGTNIPGAFFKELVKAPCHYTCPAGIDVPRYIRLIDEGKFHQALAVIKEKIPFPTVCGHVCSHPCETKCRRTQLDETVAIRALKRFVADRDSEAFEPEKIAAKTGKRVAIVGSGPAGLTAAYYLARLGHSVTVFEAFSEAGGMMRFGIPGYRLPREILDKEIDRIEGIGVEIKLNNRVKSLDELLQQDYHAVFLALGAHRSAKLEIQGETLTGVIDGVSFHRDVNLGKRVEVGKRVVVLGGGNVAIDCARTALRLGAADVHVACLEAEGCMLATPEEISWAREEGITIHNSQTPTMILGDGRQVTGVQCFGVRSFEFDGEGRLYVENIPDSEHILPADTVIIAIGQMPDLTLAEGVDGIEATRPSTLKVDPTTLATGRKSVFAGGDVVTGPLSVIEAIASGRQAAISVDIYLGGKGDIDETLAAKEEAPVTDEMKFSPLRERDKKPQLSVPCIPVAGRLSSFAEVELGFNEDQATEEAKRCLNCDLELTKLSPDTQ